MGAGGVPIRPFHEALAAAMDARGYDDRELGKGVSVPRERVTRWRTGEEVPTRSEFGRVCVHLPALRAYRGMTFAAKGGGSRLRAVLEPDAPPPGTFGPGDYGPDSFGGSDFPGVTFVAEPASAPPPRAATFGEALRREREADGSSQEELGAVLDVAPSTVSGWEREGFAPIKAHYDGLLDLYPRLREEPEPEWREGEKPGPPSGQGAPPLSMPMPPRRPDAAGSVPQSEAGQGATARGSDGPEPPPLPADPVERLLLALADVYGAGGWSVRVWGPERDVGGAWRVRVEQAGSDREEDVRGPSVPACYNELYARLDAEIDRRTAALLDLRRRIRSAA